MHKALGNFFSEYRTLSKEPDIQKVVDLLKSKRDNYKDTDEMGDVQELFSDILEMLADEEIEVMKGLDGMNRLIDKDINYFQAS